MSVAPIWKFDVRDGVCAESARAVKNVNTIRYGERRTVVSIVPYARSVRQALFSITVSSALKIRDIRKRLNLSMDEFGELIGIDRTTISRYESGQFEPSRT